MLMHPDYRRATHGGLGIMPDPADAIDPDDEARPDRRAYQGVAFVERLTPRLIQTIRMTVSVLRMGVRIG